MKYQGFLDFMAPRLAGHDYFRIMAASGHKTMSVFKRYNTVSKEELKALVGG